MKRGLAAIALAIAILMPVPLVGAAAPYDTTPPFTDQNYHEYLLYNPDTTDIDVVILPPASPYALRDLQVLKQSVQTWDQGIDALGPDWLRDGLDIDVYVAGLDNIPQDVLWDPEIVVVTAEANPVLLFGIGLESPLYSCHELVSPLTGDRSGIHQHAGSLWGVMRAECGNGGFSCFVVNTNFLSTPSDANRRDMFDLNSHELGHCLGIGHVGDAADFSALNYPRDDIMSYEDDGWNAPYVLCVSTLNILALETTYAHLLGRAPARNTAGGYVHMSPEEWRAHDCAEPTASPTDVGPITGADPLGLEPDPDPEPEVGAPLLRILQPTNGTRVQGAPVTVSGTVDRDAHVPEPLVADAGGPYAGAAGRPIEILGSFSGGSGSASCSWTGGGAFANASACATTVTFEAEGQYGIVLNVIEGEALAQDAALVDVGVAPPQGVLYFDDAYERRGTDYTDCGQLYRYAMGPVPRAAGKAYSATGFGAISCGFEFAGTTDTDMALADGVVADLYWACDEATPMVPSVDALVVATSRLVVTLRDEAGAVLGEGRYTESDPTRLLCDPNVRHTPITIMGTRVVAAGSLLIAEVVPFVVTGDPEAKWLQENLHLLVGGQTPSALHDGDPASAGSAAPMQQSLALTTTQGASSSLAATDCAGLGGVSFDPANDSLGIGAQEILCMGAALVDGRVTFGIEVADADARQNPGSVYYDVYFRPDFGLHAGRSQMVSVEYRQDGGLVAFWDAGGNDPTGFFFPAFLADPSRGDVQASRDGDVITVSFPAAYLGSPSAGDRLEAVYVDANDCGSGTTCELRHADLAPDGQDGVFTFAGSVAPSDALYFHRSDLTGASGNADQIIAGAVGLPMDGVAPTSPTPALVYTSVGDNNPDTPTVFHDAAAWTSTVDVALRGGDDVEVHWYAESPSSVFLGGWDINLFLDGVKIATVLGVAEGAAPTPTRFEATLLDVVDSDRAGRLQVWIDPSLDLDHTILYDSTDHPSGIRLLHEQPPALQAEAGGPYTGDPGVPIAIEGTYTGGNGAATCRWTTPDDGTFADPLACGTTVDFATPGTKTLNLIVNDTTASAADQAIVTVLDPAGERIEVYAGSETRPRGTLAITTPPSGPVEYALDVDLSGLRHGVTLTASWYDANGTLLDSDSVAVVVVGNEAPTAHIEGPSSGKKNRDLSFSGSASSDPEGSVLSYVWDLGDGTSASGVDVVHRYRKEGTYTITLTVTDNEGATASAAHTVVVGK